MQDGKHTGSEQKSAQNSVLTTHTFNPYTQRIIARYNMRIQYENKPEFKSFCWTQISSSTTKSLKQGISFHAERCTNKLYFSQLRSISLYIQNYRQKTCYSSTAENFNKFSPPHARTLDTFKPAEARLKKYLSDLKRDLSHSRFLKSIERYHTCNVKIAFKFIPEVQWTMSKQGLRLHPHQPLRNKYTAEKSTRILYPVLKSTVPSGSPRPEVTTYLISSRLVSKPQKPN